VFTAFRHKNVLRRTAMLNSDKVILMTKLALYEQKEGKKEIPISHYFKGDYISIHMVGSFFAITISFIIGFALWVICKADYLILNVTNMDLVALGKRILVIYLIVLAVYLVLSYIYFAYKFKKIRQNLKVYNGGLKKLHRLQDEERSNTITDRKALDQAIKEAKGEDEDGSTTGI